MTVARRLEGVGVSAGIAAGPAVVITRDLPDMPDRTPRENYLWAMIYKNWIAHYELELNWIRQLRQELQEMEAERQRAAARQKRRERAANRPGQ